MSDNPLDESNKDWITKDWVQDAYGLRADSLLWLLKVIGPFIPGAITYMLERLNHCI
jgi:hypothetical protein